MEEQNPFTKERLNLVVVGHVDHGKSTVIGRLLADTDSLPDGKLEQVRAKCEAAGKRFEYAFLLDALIDEQSQGITIDTARIFFQTAKRHYIILDAPGHIEFLRNMITGASHAEAALLVIDAEEGVQENSRRHGYMLSMLGIKNVVVLINKMDLVNHSEVAFKNLVLEYSAFLERLGTKAQHYIPISGLFGDNIARQSAQMPWYKGPHVLDVLDSFATSTAKRDNTFRMFVQDVYKFTKYGDSRRIVVGTIDSGELKAGDELVFYPSGKTTTVKSLESFNTSPLEVCQAGEAVGFTISEQIYLNRGELIAKTGQRGPNVSTRAQASLFWLGREPLSLRDEFTVKIGAARVSARVESIQKVIDAGDLDRESSHQQVGRNNVAECILCFTKPLAFDEVAFLDSTSRFVIVHNYRIWGGGIIRKGLDDKRAHTRERALVRNQKWIHSDVSQLARAERYAQKAVMLLISGPTEAPRKELARALELQLFGEGRAVYFLGIGNILYGLDADIEGEPNIGQEHIRRVAELGNLMLDAGMILIVSAANLESKDIELVQDLVGAERVRSIVFAEHSAGPEEVASPGDLKIPPREGLLSSVEKIKDLLYRDGFVFRPW